MTIWLAIGLLAVATLIPLIVVLDRRATARGARELALALHQSQLTEIDRDLAEGRILPAEHVTAKLEVQRRLLAVADSGEAGVRAGSRWPVVAVCLVVPAVAVGLYSIGGSPDLPSVTPGSAEAQAQRSMQDAALIEQLRERLATLDPSTAEARQGYILLGNAEESRGERCGRGGGLAYGAEQQVRPGAGGADGTGVGAGRGGIVVEQRGVVAAGFGGGAGGCAVAGDGGGAAAVGAALSVRLRGGAGAGAGVF